LNSNMTILLRNVIFGIGIEFIISYFLNRAFNLSIGDYKRKQFVYKRAKLYYLRTKKNQASWVK
jgi:ribosomal protein L19